MNNAVMTDSGAALLTKAQSGQCRITFTAVAVGDGTYTASEETVSALQQRQALKSERNRYSPSDVYVYSEHSVKITALITNYDPVAQETLVDEGYYIREMGIYAKETGAEDSTAILYSIATAGNIADYMQPYNGYNPLQIIQDYYATVDNSAETTIRTAGAALLAEDANVITDDSTHAKWKLGINNGNLYYEEVEE